MSQNQFKVDKARLDTFSSTFAPQNPTYYPLLGQFQEIDAKNILNPLSMEITCSARKGPEAALTQQKSRQENPSIPTVHGVA